MLLHVRLFWMICWTFAWCLQIWEKSEKSFVLFDPAFQHPGHARSSPLHRAKINPKNEGTNPNNKKSGSKHYKNRKHILKPHNSHVQMTEGHPFIYILIRGDPQVQTKAIFWPVEITGQATGQEVNWAMGCKNQSGNQAIRRNQTQPGELGRVSLYRGFIPHLSLVPIFIRL